jgi:hypothetical protein
MYTLTKKPGEIRSASGATLPRSISDVTLRDISWIIVGMLLAYLTTVI